MTRKERSARNKTIDFSLDSEEGKKYSSGLMTVEEISAEGNFIDRVICGDCIEAMRRLPRELADLIIVDPPYNLTKDFHGSRFDASDPDTYRAFTEEWMNAALPLLKPNGSIYVCCDWYSGMVIGGLLEERLELRGRITWQREKGRGAEKNWKNGMEDIWFATAGKDYTFNLDAVKQRRRVIAPYRSEGEPKDWSETEDGRFRDTCPSNFWDDISVPYWSMAENTAHPTQKPEKLLAKLILAGSNEGDTVFDPFGGSGSTAVCAKKLGRHFVTVEQNRLYCAWAEKRLEDAERDKSIQGYSDGVFWERNTAAYLLNKGRSNKNGKNS